MNTKRIAVLGGGSWATAIVKMLSPNVDKLSWYMRNTEAIEFMRSHRRNPRYLSTVELEVDKINFFDDLNEAIDSAELLIMAIPAAFMKDALSYAKVNLEGKFIMSAVKGIIPGDNLIIADFFHKYYNIPFEAMSVIAGPCHAEEVAMERLSYITIASPNLKIARQISRLFMNSYIKVSISNDLVGTEYAAVLKNIYAVAAGVCKGLGYGDNFQAVLVANAIQEIKRFIATVHPKKRDIKGSAYLGDLLVTAYSQFSRNRTFGSMIGQAYSVKSAQLEMNMVAEGYYATKCIWQINKEHKINMPICDAMYNIIYRHISPTIEIKLLTEHLR